MKAHLILYVRDQSKATAFYSKVLMLQPSLEVPGMTEFRLSEGVKLGLMLEESTGRLLGESVSFVDGSVRARAELYLVVQDAADFHDRAVAAGAIEVSPLQERDWGHRVAYSKDPDAHILAFAEVGSAPE